MEAVTPPRLIWQEAAVTRLVEYTPAVKGYWLKVPDWPGFMAGQHVDVRLTAPDGYQAQRSYSIGSAPEESDIELVIEKLDSGEVSPFFHDVVQVGDMVEMRGPIGGHFTWGAEDGGPLLLVGGGSGVVPMMSMLRHRATVAPEVPTVLVYSARHYGDLIFRDEIFERAENDKNLMTVVTITREKPTDPRVRSGRIDGPIIADAFAKLGGMPRRAFVCGANAFVDVASRLLLDMGVPFPSIKTERYGGDPAREGGAAQPVPGA